MLHRLKTADGCTELLALRDVRDCDIEQAQRDSAPFVAHREQEHAIDGLELISAAPPSKLCR